MQDTAFALPDQAFVTGASALIVSLELILLVIILRTSRTC
jgi:hypothetical protein